MSGATRNQLIAAIKASATEVWSPWFVLGLLPDDDADAFADVAVSRWRSRGRRQTGRRDPVRDLAKGFRESRKIHPKGEGAISSIENEDFLALASHLIPILKDSPPEPGLPRREAH